MTKERLFQLNIDELKILAQKEDIEIPETGDKEELIDCILEELAEIEGDRNIGNNPTVKIEEKKYIIGHDEEIDLKEGEEFFVPEKYKCTRIVLLVRDPSWAYTYWEISEDKVSEMRNDPGFEGIFLRIHDVKFIDFNGTNSNYFIDIPVLLSDTSWYINIPNPDSVYIIELLFSSKGEKKLIARSNPIQVPRESFSDKRDNEWNSQNTDKIIEIIMSDFEYFLPASGSIPQRIISFVSSSFIPYIQNK
jgi:hypothetical protein